MKKNSNFFTVIAVIISLGGLVFGIALGFVCRIDISGIFESAKLRFNVGLMIQTWIISDIIALAFHWMALVLRKFENIEKALGADDENETLLSGINFLANNLKNSVSSVSSKNPTNNTTTYNSNQSANGGISAVPPQNTSKGTNEWECPKCGKINKNYIGTCGCGQTKPK